MDSIIAPVVTALGYELVGVEHVSQGRHSLLRVYIDAPDGIALEDCERVSQQLSATLDVEDPIKGQYLLEISSPGLDRPLFTAEHFERFSGHRARLRLRQPLEQRRKLTGVLRGVRDGTVVIELEEGEVAVPLEAIDKANLVPEF